MLRDRLIFLAPPGQTIKWAGVSDSRKKFLSSRAASPDEPRLPLQTIHGARYGVKIMSGATIEIGTKLGSYEIRDQVGEGGNSVVYLAHDTNLGCDVALKVLRQNVLHVDSQHGSSSGDTESFQRRFWRECKTVGRLNHPHIVRARFAGNEDDVTYLAMDYVPGANLTQTIETQQEADWKTLWTWMWQLCDALEYAHEAGVIHRDLKPSNVLIDADNTAKIVDFGIALAHAEEVLDRNTQLGTVLGTPDYMSPEQISNPLAVDERSDIYGLGGIFYFVLFGEGPVARQTSCRRKLAAQRTLDPTWKKPRCSLSWSQAIRLRRLVLGMLAKNADRRPQSVRDVKQRLLKLQPINMARTNAGRNDVFGAPMRWRSSLVFLACGVAAMVIISFLYPEGAGRLFAALSSSSQNASKPLSHAPAHTDDSDRHERAADGPQPNVVGSRKHQASFEPKADGTPSSHRNAHDRASIVEFDEEGMHGAGSTRACVVGVEVEDAPTVRSAERLFVSLPLRSKHDKHDLLVSRMLSGGPSLARIKQTLTACVEDARPNDRLIFYFSGPVTQRGDGQLYLVPHDERLRTATEITNAPTHQLLPLAWIGELVKRSNLKHGLFVIDAIAYSSSDIPVKKHAYTCLPAELEVVASHQTEAGNYQWRRRDCGLLTYCLCQALAGNADVNRNGDLSPQELADYANHWTHRFLPLVSLEHEARRAEVAASQVPVRRSNCPHESIVDGWKPKAFPYRDGMYGLSQAVDDLVFHDTQTNEGSLAQQVAVSPFVQLDNKRPSVNAKYGCFGNLSAEWMARHLVVESKGDYRVLLPDEVGEQLRGIELTRRRDPQVWLDTKIHLFVDTTFGYDPRTKRIDVEASVLDTATGQCLGRFRRLIVVDQELSAILDGSQQLAYLGPIGAESGSSTIAVSSHPFINNYEASNLELNVQVGKRFREQHIRFENAEVHVCPDDNKIAQFEVEKGDELKIAVRNRTDERVAVVVYVDGVNIFNRVRGMPPHEAITKGKYFLIRAQSSFSYDRWYQEVESSGDKRRMLTNRFKIVDCHESVVNRCEYGARLGEIRIVAYRAKQVSSGQKGASRPGVGNGQAGETTVNIVPFVADRNQPLEVIVIRYVEKKAKAIRPAGEIVRS